MFNRTIKTTFIIFVLCCAFLLTGCITPGKKRAETFDKSTAHIQKLYAQDYYEIEKPPPGLHYSPKKSVREFVL